MPSNNKKKEADKKKPAANATVNRTNDSENVVAAHDEALSDIEQDADLSIHSPNDDLDEGETARLGEDKTDLV